MSKVTVGAGTPEQKELEIIEFVQVEYTGGRLVTNSKLEDGSYLILVENAEDSGREKQQALWLTEESFFAVVANCMLYSMHKGQDVKDVFNKIVEDGQDYRYSKNFNPLEY